MVETFIIIGCFVWLLTGSIMWMLWIEPLLKEEQEYQKNKKLKKEKKNNENE